MAKKANTNKVSLLEMAMSATKENIVKGTRRKSINDSLFELLFTNGEVLTKQEIIARISLERLEAQMGAEELTPELFGSDEVQDVFAKINKTVKNGFETAVCAGKTSASFQSNKRYSDYRLLKTAQGEYSIVEK